MAAIVSPSVSCHEARANRFFFHCPFYVHLTFYQHLSWWRDPNPHLKITEPLQVLSVSVSCFPLNFIIEMEVLRSGPMSPLGLEHCFLSPGAQQQPSFPLVVSSVMPFSSCRFNGVRNPRMARDKLSFQFIRSMAVFLGRNIPLRNQHPKLSSPQS